MQYLEGPAAGTAPNTIPFLFLPRNTSAAIITTTAIDTRGGGFGTPTEDLLRAYEKDDQRLDASIGVAEGTYNGSDLFAYSGKRPGTTYFTTNAPSGKVSVPYILKYLFPPYLAANRGTNQNWPIYRYSEALLLLAEARNEQNKATALAPLNLVRTRAFGAGKGQITAADQAALRTIIMKERRVEFAFENKRYHDLVRTGTAVQVLNDHGVEMKLKYPTLPPGAYQVTENKLLLPIPQTEIDANPGMPQNPL